MYSVQCTVYSVQCTVPLTFQPVHMLIVSHHLSLSFSIHIFSCCFHAYHGRLPLPVIPLSLTMTSPCHSLLLEYCSECQLDFRRCPFRPPSKSRWTTRRASLRRTRCCMLFICVFHLCQILIHPSLPLSFSSTQRARENNYSSRSYT